MSTSVMSMAAVSKKSVGLYAPFMWCRCRRAVLHSQGQQASIRTGRGRQEVNSWKPSPVHSTL